MAYNPHSSSSNLLSNLEGLEGQISSDEPSAEASRAANPPARTQHLGPPSNASSRPPANAAAAAQNLSSADLEEGQSIWKQSAHPVALFFLYSFRCLAIATYLLCGFFSSSYVFSTVLVVVLLSLDFWTVRNVSGRVLVGLRFWNQVDEDGTSFWVFESRSPEQPANKVDAKMFWIAMYSFPAAWVLLLFVGILKFNLSFLPIVMLALVFNLTNTVGGSSTLLADRDSKRRWATGMAANGMLGSMGGFGGSIVTGLASTAYSKFFG
ncbi:Tvp23p [Sporobolomyces koalae]|uniref:Tvp23p n=1 Tax=Sporobolomyces koalae TaxID=500713 RepID=UPI0031779D2A